MDYVHRIQSLQAELKQKNQIIQDLKERNLVLERRESVTNSQNFPDDSNADVDAVESESVSIAPTTQEPALEPTVGSPAAASIDVPKGENGEHYLYSKILETYRTRNQSEMQATLRLLLRTYPDSVFVDNAVYLSGLLSYESGDVRTALKTFEQVIHDYPRSNKVVSSIFARGNALKKLGRNQEARQCFQSIKDLYPGSPEANRVSVELKLLSQATSKSRES